MMEALEVLLSAKGIPFDRVQNRGRCFPHVVNIAVQTALKMLSKSAPEPDAMSEDSPPENITLRADPVNKCRTLVANCRKSSQRREDFIATIKEGNDKKQWHTTLPVNQLLRDVDTRWSSTFLMIDRVLELNEAINVFLEKNKQAPISTSRLSSMDITVLDDIRHVLDLPHVVQQSLSSEKTPTLCNVLPTYEELVKSLKDIESAERYKYLKPAISAAIRKIEVYMASARETKFYVLALGKPSDIFSSRITSNILL
ncbi:hypothetical protein DENSPDRAFT_909366 [Dentipellis sp. KUC8613]|nr:hypothetical protein DENSPDRAFT_909366 [Dentipellis sp. KUC8613]